jgi:hypothetical protein
MNSKEARIFLSYTHKDEKEVMNLYRRLKEAGYNPWIDSEDILGGEDWEKAIEKAIKEAALFIPCLTNNSINHRGVVQFELKFALKIWELKLENDIYLIPVRLEDCPIPGSLSRFHCINLFKENGFQRLINSIDAAFDRLEVFTQIQIRLRPEPSEGLSVDEVKEMLRTNDFYHKSWYWMGRGLQHEYELKDIKGERVVLDHTTKLMCQQSGSEIEKSYAEVKAYIKELNKKKFAGFSDWRLPTLEEAMSLIEPDRYEETEMTIEEEILLIDELTDRFIHSLFDKKQQWLWTADQDSESEPWTVNIYYGSCDPFYGDRSGTCVRAVRSRH